MSRLEYLEEVLARVNRIVREDAEALYRGERDGPDTYPIPEHGWTCFHCGETFKTVAAASLHFGPGDRQWRRPACVIVEEA